MKKTVLITGAAKRIGKAIALKLASLGYNIALHYNSSEKEALQVARAIKRKKVTCTLFQCDLLDSEKAECLIPDVVSKCANLEILVNNASIYQKTFIKDTDTEFLKEQLQVNFIAPYILSREFATSRKKGHIINILDTKIAKNETSCSSYLISKKALGTFTKLAAIEFAPDIRVNAIAPGLILPPKGKGEAYLDKLARNVPLQTKGSVEDITNAIQFLIVSKYITGQILYIDGGQFLTGNIPC